MTPFGGRCQIFDRFVEDPAWQYELPPEKRRNHRQCVCPPELLAGLVGEREGGLRKGLKSNLQEMPQNNPCCQPDDEGAHDCQGIRIFLRFIGVFWITPISFARKWVSGGVLQGSCPTHLNTPFWKSLEYCFLWARMYRMCILSFAESGIPHRERLVFWVNGGVTRHSKTSSQRLLISRAASLFGAYCITETPEMRDCT